MEGRIDRNYYEYWKNRAILAPHRATATAVNNEVAELFPNVRICTAVEKVSDPDAAGCDPGTGFGPEHLKDLCPGGMVSQPHNNKRDKDRAQEREKRNLEKRERKRQRGKRQTDRQTDRQTEREREETKRQTKENTAPKD